MDRKILAVVSSLIIGLVAPLLLAIPVYATFSSHKLMVDSIFTDYGSMNASQIDNFLNSFSSSCLSKNNHFSSPDPIGYSPSTGFKYGSKVSGGTVIYHAAQAYHLNPKVILATLQKESSVVSGTATYHCQYINTAMGYDCPDNGNCPRFPATESGFSKQVIWGTWLLKFSQQRSLGNVNWAEIHGSWDNSDDPPTFYSGPMTQGYRARVQGGSTAYYDGYTTIDGSSVHMDTGATASLYRYTPHFRGNQSFVNIYEHWFGSTINGMPILYNTAHPDGTLVRDITNDTVYLIIAQQLHHVPNLNVFASHNYSWDEVRPATPKDLTLTINSSNIAYQSGSLVRGTDDKVYDLQCSNYVCTKLHIASLAIFHELGFSSNQVLDISQATINGFANGADITSSSLHPKNTVIIDQSTKKVYLISVNQKNWIPNLKIFKANHFNWAYVETATSDDIQLNDGSNVVYPEGELLRANNSSDVYVIDQNDTDSTFAKRLITDQVVFKGLGYGPKDIFVDDPSMLPATTGAALTQ